MIFFSFLILSFHESQGTATLMTEDGYKFCVLSRTVVGHGNSKFQWLV